MHFEEEAVTLVTVYDATHDNIGHLPPGQHAGYTTGTGGVAWTPEDWKAHPYAIRICQDTGASDRTADMLDVESGAATVDDVPGWAQDAHANRVKGVRPGQRWPGVYASLSKITPVANALVAAKITFAVYLWIADWSETTAQVDAQLADAGGPFPVVGVQYANRGAYDVSLFSAAWLSNVAGAPKPVSLRAEFDGLMAPLVAFAAKLPQ